MGNCELCGTPVPKRTNHGKPQRWCSHKCCDIARREPNDVRFWRQVKKTAKCWLWTGPRNRQGYGRMFVVLDTGKYIEMPAHRFAWELKRGPIPVGKKILHHCDNPPCIRVHRKHLFQGTSLDNTRDMIAKGRARFCGPKNPVKGVRHHRAKLNDDKIREIRTLYKAGLSQQAIANRFDVCQTLISGIVRSVSWKHITS